MSFCRFKLFLSICVTKSACDNPTLFADIQKADCCPSVYANLI